MVQNLHGTYFACNGNLRILIEFQSSRPIMNTSDKKRGTFLESIYCRKFTSPFFRIN